MENLCDLKLEEIGFDDEEAVELDETGLCDGEVVGLEEIQVSS
jgi:hypothetical protein